ncbi:MAG: hypothetical protein H8D72_02150, partial [Planctomycetes bacterium]|nr:hypothetical protein [Planctomycetota bacterium]
PAAIWPVGARTLKESRFQARVWLLEKTPSTCAECSRGCSVSVEVLRRQDVKRLRPLFNADVNKWWMCDTGRFSFEHLNDPERLTGGLIASGQDLLGATVREAIEHAGTALRGTKPAVIASPFLTQEEGAALAELAKGLGAKVQFVSPEPNGLKDDLLHTGDPCPNRRGLEQLGFQAISAKDAAAAVTKAGSGLLVGERVLKLLADQNLGAAKLVTLDTHPCLAAGVEASVAVPFYVEKAGTWINVDGHKGRLTIARVAPSGVQPLTRSLGELQAALGLAGAKA